MAEHPEFVQNLMSSPQIHSMAQNIASDPNLLNMLQPNRMNNPEQIRQVAQQLMGNSQLQNMMQNPQVRLFLYFSVMFKKKLIIILVMV